jgi:exopolysaccharide production protein ExoQ
MAARAAPGIILSIGAFVLPPLAVFAPLGLAPLQGVLALALLAADWRGLKDTLREGTLLPLAFLWALLALWATASGWWSLLPQHSFLEGLRLFAIGAGGFIPLLAGVALDGPARRRLGIAALAGVAVAILLLLGERAFNPDLARFDRGTTTILLALWPAFAAVAARRWRSAGLALLLAGAATPLLMVSTSAALAMVVSLVILALAYFAARLATICIAAGVLLVALGLPLATPSYQNVVAIHQHAPWLKQSAIHRLLIWRFTAERIAEEPWRGWGMDASRGMPGGLMDFHQSLPEAGVMAGSVALPLHPHNAALQWQAELGVPGMLLCLALIFWGLWRVGWRSTLPRGIRAGALAWCAAALVIAFLSYGIWQAWWLSCLWLTASFFAGIAEEG